VTVYDRRAVIRVLVADDNAVIRHGVAALLEASADDNAGVAGQSGVKSGAYLRYFGGPLAGQRVRLGMP
jgi:CheY-like chemotaxis protein